MQKKNNNNNNKRKKTRKIKREWKKKPYFFTCVRKTFANQLLTRYPPFAPLAQVDEWKENPSPFSIQGLLSEFSQFMAAETLINSLSLTDNDAQTFLEGEENQCTKKKKTESYVFSGFGNCISCGWERKSTGRFGRLPERFPLSARKSQSMIIAMHLALEMMIYFTSSLVQKLLDLHDFDCPHRESHRWDHH